MRTESRRWLWVVVAGFPLPPSLASPPSSCLLLSPLRAGLSAAWRVARSARPPARLSVCLVCLAHSLPPSLALALPACLSPSPPPPPLPLRARLTFAAHHPEPQGGTRAQHAGTCSPRPGRSVRPAGGAARLLRRRGLEPTGRRHPDRSGGIVSRFPRGAGFPRGLGAFAKFFISGGVLWLEEGCGWEGRGGV